MLFTTFGLNEELLTFLTNTEASHATSVATTAAGSSGISSLVTFGMFSAPVGTSSVVRVGDPWYTSGRMAVSSVRSMSALAAIDPTVSTSGIKAVGVSCRVPAGVGAGVSAGSPPGTSGSSAGFPAGVAAGEVTVINYPWCVTVVGAGVITGSPPGVAVKTVSVPMTSGTPSSVSATGQVELFVGFASDSVVFRSWLLILDLEILYVFDLLVGTCYCSGFCFGCCCG